ncbi:putative transcriptional regulator containing an HTH domain fused to a Zn-ribbon [Archaeoglobus sulfaticallidus PM70-1]|uniref:Putative transcriptional regulator containing an HTH domain fused to a Zn-ribbon n=1 Tax=Archaeoglobus sulfaticallidus PM70-1 TaxID=387631 RepID=N0BEZ3_9EURY|nr:transcriptional regulator [Archaeoglobus sulfaticallidus]AGK61578.1 putative transcriptional regulator containing an HTH domain fused to a Zn-ribbon [Archaeoglobus sulfaticallidus PM70-1]
MTLVEKLIDLLIDRRSLTASDVIRELKLDPKMRKDVLNAFEKAGRVLKKKGFRLLVAYPECRKCGFVLKNIGASKCPKCKSEWISEAVFMVE